MSQIMNKVCRVCGEDVSAKKRTKDTQGNYYCQPCYDDQVATAKPRASHQESPSGHSAINEASHVCTACGGSFSVNDVYEDSGRIVCKQCFESQNVSSAPRPARAPTASPSTGKSGGGTALALRVGFVLALVFLGLSLLGSITAAMRNTGAGVASAAASILLWGGLAFALRVASKKTDAAHQNVRGSESKSSNRSVGIALTMIVVAVVGTFIVYYQVYMAPTHNSIVADNVKMAARLDAEGDRLKEKQTALDADAIAKAAVEGRLADIEVELARGINVNARGSEGHTALTSAVVGKKPEAVKLLLKRGADPDITSIDPSDKVETTPLGWAALLGNAEIAAVLVAGGADTTKRSGGQLPHELVPKDGPAMLRDGLRALEKEKS
jgi:hypothetical protein